MKGDVWYMIFMIQIIKHLSLSSVSCTVANTDPDEQDKPYNLVLYTKMSNEQSPKQKSKNKRH